MLVVDKLPQGICNELQRALKLIRSRGRTHCVLGLRDVLDEPAVAAREWAAAGNDEIIEKYFDEVWVYGDPKVYDCRAEYSFRPSTADRIRFTGYLDQQARLADAPDERDSAHPLALCVVGGGQDGLSLAQAFVQAGVPSGWRRRRDYGTVHAHRPQVGTDSRGAREGVTIIDQLVEADVFLRQASRVVAMGGYNTVMSVLSFRKPALIVPRTTPRAEQWIRASRLADAGLITALHPQDLRPAAIRAWLEQPSAADPSRHSIDLGGLERIQSRVMRLALGGACCV